MLNYYGLWHAVIYVIVKAHACTKDLSKESEKKEDLGRSKGSFTTKTHALVDSLDNPLKFILTSSQRNDITQAENLTSNIKNRIVVGEKGYNANKLLENLRLRIAK